ncbi:MAG: MOSC domain-containing protein [Candidatus Tyrphobacter sp.]
MRLGTLETIRRYPVKSLGGQTLAETEIGENGIPGDRTQRLVVESGHARIGREYRGIEDERLHLVQGVGQAKAMAGERGVALRVESGGRYHYANPITLVMDRWLKELSAFVGYAVEPERFRPNLAVHAADDFAFAEADLFGATLEVGNVRLKVRKPISRCVTITFDPGGGAADPRILRFVAQERDAKMGVYCDVLRAGTARSGDSVRLVDR